MSTTKNSLKLYEQAGLFKYIINNIHLESLTLSMFLSMRILYDNPLVFYVWMEYNEIPILDGNNIRKVHYEKDTGNFFFNFVMTYRLHPLRGAWRKSSSESPYRPKQAKSQAIITKAVIAASLNGSRATVRNAVCNTKCSHVRSNSCIDI